MKIRLRASQRELNGSWLEEENRKLKELVAEQELNIATSTRRKHERDGPTVKVQGRAGIPVGQVLRVSISTFLDCGVRGCSQVQARVLSLTRTKQRGLFNRMNCSKRGLV
jgi:hypothetical protein